MEVQENITYNNCPGPAPGAIIKMVMSPVGDESEIFQMKQTEIHVSSTILFHPQVFTLANIVILF